MQKLWLLFFVLLAGCATHSPPPIVERAPIKKPPVAIKPKDTNQENDWRPDTYTVKKGDTLFAIGLEYGYDYKEIASANNINSPYTIKVGQQLKLQSLKAKTTMSNNNEVAVTTPLKTEPAPQSNSIELTTIRDPKATREPYSDEGLASQAPKASIDKVASKTEPSKSETKLATESKTTDDTKPNTDEINWAWPTNGKVITAFNESGNTKGIDIAGSQGQAIKAAATGKVIYNGSDLRGYGKLVIIKHSNNFLSVYAHNSLILVKEGQQVNQGQKIAEMGNTDADRFKLHFEIRKQGKSVDPAKYLDENSK
jgi:lipoprotein NlpD